MRENRDTRTLSYIKFIQSIIFMLKKYLKFVTVGAIIGPIVFVILTTIAMFLYPGGYGINGVVTFTTSYQFHLNFFSDLGMLVTETFLSNLPSSILFAIATTIVGVTFILYSLTMPYYFEKKTPQRALAIFGTIFAIISSIGYIIIGFTPWDVFLGAHMIGVFTGFPVSTVFCAFFAIAIFLEKKYPNLFAWIFGIFTACMIAYVIILFEGPSGSTLDGRIFQVLAQKVIVYLMMAIILIQAIGTYQVLKKRQWLSEYSGSHYTHKAGCRHHKNTSLVCLSF